MKKRCTKCNQDKPVSDFHRKNATRTQSYCKPCFNAYCVERWRKRKLEAIAYLGGKCKSCGYSEHYAALQFHHLRDKDVSWNKLRLRSWSKIIRELDKCELLCANCHAVVHSGE